MPRKQHQYHYIYKTTCNVTNRFYFGMHSTDNLNDGYLGSGQRLWKSINKHGKENHSIEILEFLPNREALMKREAELITEYMLKDPNCMNLIYGGTGGNVGANGEVFGGDKFRAVHQYRKEHPEILSNLATKTFTNAWNTPEFREKMSKKKPFLNKKHSSETKKKIGEANSLKQKGSNNSQFGTMWITNGVKNKKVKKDSDLPNDWRRGRI